MGNAESSLPEESEATPVVAPDSITEKTETPVADSAALQNVESDETGGESTAEVKPVTPANGNTESVENPEAAKCRSEKEEGIDCNSDTSTASNTNNANGNTTANTDVDSVSTTDVRESQNVSTTGTISPLGDTVPSSETASGGILLTRRSSPPGAPRAKSPALQRIPASIYLPSSSLDGNKGTGADASGMSGPTAAENNGTATSGSGTAIKKTELSPEVPLGFRVLKLNGDQIFCRFGQMVGGAVNEERPLPIKLLSQLSDAEKSDLEKRYLRKAGHVGLCWSEEQGCYTLVDVEEERKAKSEEGKNEKTDGEVKTGENKSGSKISADGDEGTRDNLGAVQQQKSKDTAATTGSKDTTASSYLGLLDGGEGDEGSEELGSSIDIGAPPFTQDDDQLLDDDGNPLTFADMPPHFVQPGDRQYRLLDGSESPLNGANESVDVRDVYKAEGKEKEDSNTESASSSKNTASAESGTKSATEAAVAPSITEQVVEKITAIYQLHNPDKLASIPTFLEKYHDHKQLYAKVCKKYGVKPEKLIDPVAASDGKVSDEANDSSSVNVNEKTDPENNVGKRVETASPEAKCTPPKSSTATDKSAEVKKQSSLEKMHSSYKIDAAPIAEREKTDEATLRLMMSPIEATNIEQGARPGHGSDVSQPPATTTATTTATKKGETISSSKESDIQTSPDHDEIAPDPIYFVPVTYLQELLGDAMDFHPQLISVLEERSGDGEAEGSAAGGFDVSSAEESDRNNVVLADAVNLDQLFIDDDSEITFAEKQTQFERFSPADFSPWKMNLANLRSAFTQLGTSKKKHDEANKSSSSGPDKSNNTDAPAIRYIPILNNSPPNTLCSRGDTSSVLTTPSYTLRAIAVARWAHDGVDSALGELSPFELSYFGLNFCWWYCFKSGHRGYREDFFQSKEWRSSLDGSLDNTLVAEHFQSNVGSFESDAKKRCRFFPGFITPGRGTIATDYPDTFKTEKNGIWWESQICAAYVKTLSRDQVIDLVSENGLRIRALRHRWSPESGVRYHNKQEGLFRKDVITSALRSTNYAWEFAPRHLKHQKTIVIEAINSKRQFHSSDVILRSITSQHPEARVLDTLGHTPKAEKWDLCLAAVRNSGCYALQLLSDLHNNVGLVLEAVRVDCQALRSGARTNKKETDRPLDFFPAMIGEVAANNCQIMREIIYGKFAKKNPSFKGGDLLLLAGKRPRDDKQLVIQALRSTRCPGLDVLRVFEKIATRLQRDREVVVEAVSNDVHGEVFEKAVEIAEHEKNPVAASFQPHDDEEVCVSAIRATFVDVTLVFQGISQRLRGNERVLDAVRQKAAWLLSEGQKESTEAARLKTDAEEAEKRATTIEKAKEAMSAAAAQFGATAILIETECNDASERKRGREEAAERLREEVSKMRDEADTLDSESNTVKDHARRIRRDENQLSEQAQKVAEQAVALRSEVHEAKASVNALEKVVEDSERALEEKKKRKKGKTLPEQQSDIVATTHEAKHLEDDLRRNNAALKRANDHLGTVESVADTLLKQAATLEQESHKAKTEACHRESEEDRLGKDAKRLDAEADRLDAEADRIDSEAEKQGEEVDRMQEEKQRISKEEQKLKKEVASLAKEVVKIRGEAKKLRSEITKIEARSKKHLLDGGRLMSALTESREHEESRVAAKIRKADLLQEKAASCVEEASALKRKADEKEALGKRLAEEEVDAKKRKLFWKRWRLRFAAILDGINHSAAKSAGGGVPAADNMANVSLEFKQVDERAKMREAELAKLEKEEREVDASTDKEKEAREATWKKAKEMKEKKVKEAEAKKGKKTGKQDVKTKRNRNMTKGQLSKMKFKVPEAWQKHKCLVGHVKESANEGEKTWWEQLRDASMGAHTEKLAATRKLKAGPSSPEQKSPTPEGGKANAENADAQKGDTKNGSSSGTSTSTQGTGTTQGGTEEKKEGTDAKSKTKKRSHFEMANANAWEIWLDSRPAFASVRNSAQMMSWRGSRKEENAPDEDVQAIAAERVAAMQEAAKLRRFATKKEREAEKLSADSERLTADADRAAAVLSDIIYEEEEESEDEVEEDEDEEDVEEGGHEWDEDDEVVYELEF